MDTVFHVIIYLLVAFVFFMSFRTILILKFLKHKRDTKTERYSYHNFYFGRESLNFDLEDGTYTETNQNTLYNCISILLFLWPMGIPMLAIFYGGIFIFNFLCGIIDYVAMGCDKIITFGDKLNKLKD